MLIAEYMLIPAAERAKARFCGRSLTGVAGSNPDGGMDVFVVCVVQLVQKAKSQDNQDKEVRIKCKERTKTKKYVKIHCQCSLELKYIGSNPGVGHTFYFSRVVFLQTLNKTVHIHIIIYLIICFKRYLYCIGNAISASGKDISVICV